MSEISTWYEIYEGEKLNIDSSIQKIQDSMYRRNPEKYWNFLSKLSEVEKALKAKFIPNVWKRIELFKYVYYAMRLIDDVVDGDTVPPLEWQVRKNILDTILGHDSTWDNNPLYEALRSKIQQLSQELWIKEDLDAAIQEIVISMNFDLERILDNNKYRTRAQLERNFHAMDIEGTIKWTALIFGIDPASAIDILEPLWQACRTMYNLRDFTEDIRASLINIPMEDIDRFGITPEELAFVKAQENDFDFSQLPESIKRWFRQELLRMKEFMERYKYNTSSKKLKYTDILSPLLVLWRDWYVMKKRVLPETYEREVYERLDQILSQVT